jgi:hypothetical protein
VGSALVLSAGCAWPSPERQFLLDFFQACRVYDTAVLARLATVSCNPKTDGIVQDFVLVNVEREGDAARRVTIRARVRSWQGGVSDQAMTVGLEYATSNFANFARSVFCPTELNRTTSFRSSSSGSTLRTTPSPNFGWRTRTPGRSPASTDWSSSS